MTKQELQHNRPHSDNHADTVGDPPAKEVLRRQQDVYGVGQSMTLLEDLL